jgi:DNA-directed RNA polymerase subunit RPC12/RpoP
MPAVAEYVCQSCGKVTWGDVPTRTDTMPVCPCGGRRQIVRIRHTAAKHLDGLGLSAAERARD